MGETLGMRIRRLREERGIKVTRFAALVDAHYYTVNHWECDRREPKLSSAVRIAGALGVSVGELVEGIDGNILARQSSAGVAGRD